MIWGQVTSTWKRCPVLCVILGGRSCFAEQGVKAGTTPAWLCPTERRDVDRHAHGERARWRQGWGDASISQLRRETLTNTRGLARASWPTGATSPAHASTSGFWPPELGGLSTAEHKAVWIARGQPALQGTASGSREAWVCTRFRGKPERGERQEVGVQIPSKGNRHVVKQSL